MNVSPKRSDSSLAHCGVQRWFFFPKRGARDKTNAHLWTVCIWVRPLEWCTWSPFLFSDECVRRRQQHFPTRAREHSTMNFSNAILQRPRELVVTSFDNCKFIDELFAKRGDKSIQSNIWNNSAMILIPDPKRGDNNMTIWHIYMRNIFIQRWTLLPKRSDNYEMADYVSEN